MFGNLTPIVKNLLLINIVIHFCQDFLQFTLSGFFGLWSSYSEFFHPHQLFTYMFLHGDWFHLLGNMIGLFFFGPMLERVWGPKKFLTFYVIAGLGAGILYTGIDAYKVSGVKNAAENFYNSPSPEGFNYFIQNYYPDPKRALELVDQYYENPNDNTLRQNTLGVVQSTVEAKSNGRLVGASGAIIAILTAFGLLFPNTVIFLLFPPMPIKAKYLVLLYGAYEIYSELNRTVGDNIAHLAHLSGMLIAIILVKIVWKNDRNTLY